MYWISHVTPLRPCRSSGSSEAESLGKLLALLFAGEVVGWRFFGAGRKTSFRLLLIGLFVFFLSVCIELLIHRIRVSAPLWGGSSLDFL